MKKYQFRKADAFATEKSDGNPAGYILLNKLSDMTDVEMLHIAKELKGFVSEVGYVAQTGEYEYDFKYYSSERELDFCGHVTIATMYELIKNREIKTHNSFFIHTNRGRLEVENRIPAEDSVFVMAPEPFENNTIPAASEIAARLRLRESEIAGEFPVSIINAGLETLIVPIAGLESILGIQPDLDELNEFCVNSGVDIIEVFTPEVYENTNDFRTRVFAPTFGYIEDPATGSGNSAFGYYLIKNGLWKNETITIEQNGLRDRYNVVKLQKKPDANNNQRVWFGGAAIVRIEGEYFIYPPF